MVQLLGLSVKIQQDCIHSSRAYEANNNYDVGNIDGGAADDLAVEGITIAYAADVFSIAASIEETDLMCKMTTTILSFLHLHWYGKSYCRWRLFLSQRKRIMPQKEITLTFTHPMQSEKH